MSRKPIIETRNLTKTFAQKVVAVNALTLSVPEGAVYGLVGRNGAGKSTTLRLLMGLLQPDQGEAMIFGQSMASAPSSLRERVAYVSQSSRLPGWMALSDLFRCCEKQYSRWDSALAEQLLKSWGLKRSARVNTLSGGEQRKAAIVLALASRADVLLLDEPGAGLDPISRRELLDALVDALTRETTCTVLISTHLISDLERMAEYVGFMEHGNLAASVRLEDVLQQTRRVQLVFEGSTAPANLKIPGAFRVRATGPVVTALVRLSLPGQSEVIEQTRGARVQWFPVNLEELFIDWFGPDMNPGPTDFDEWKSLQDTDATTATFSRR